MSFETLKEKLEAAQKALQEFSDQFPVGYSVMTREQEDAYWPLHETYNALEAERDCRAEEIVVPETIQDMTDEQLEEALYEVDMDRKYFIRECRKKGWTKEDEETYDNMNKFAADVFEEILKRGKHN